MRESSRGQVGVAVKRTVHILTGLALVSLGAYFVLGLAHGWHSLWHKEVNQVAVQPKPPKRPVDPDDVTEAARLHVYGVLAPMAESTSADGDDSAAPPATAPVTALDHVHASPSSGPQRLLHRRFAVKSYQSFSFVVPAHTIRPRVAGTFNSSAKGDRAEAGNLSSANVDIMLLNQQEFEDLLHDQEGTTSFSTEGPDGEVDWTLGPTFSEPQKYYLVFHNSGRSIPELLDVDFTISFE